MHTEYTKRSVYTQTIGLQSCSSYVHSSHPYSRSKNRQHQDPTLQNTLQEPGASAVAEASAGIIWKIRLNLVHFIVPRRGQIGQIGQIGHTDDNRIDRNLRLHCSTCSTFDACNCHSPELHVKADVRVQHFQFIQAALTKPELVP